MGADRATASVRALRVLLGISAKREGVAGVRERWLELDAHRVRHFAPLGDPRRQLVLLHGLTSRGASDLRLERLARLLAREGIACWVPQLPGLTRFVEDRADLELADACVVHASREGCGSTSLLGFSLGGGYALVLSSRADLAELIEHVTSVGGHHDLAEVWRCGSDRLRRLPSRLEEASESELYAALACAAQRLTTGELSSTAQAELSRTLFDFCQHVELPSVRQFIRTQLLPHWGAIEQDRPCATSAELSPAGHLTGVRASVALLHSTDDSLVPPHHAQRNFAELSQRPGATQRLCVTGLLEHVAPRLSEHWRDLPALVAAFARLL